MKNLSILILITILASSLSLLTKKIQSTGQAADLTGKNIKQLNSVGFPQAIISELNQFRKKEHYQPVIKWESTLASTAGEEAQGLVEKKSFGEHTNFQVWQSKNKHQLFTELAVKINTYGDMPSKRIFAKVLYEYNDYTQTIIETLKQEKEWFLIHEYNHGGVAMYFYLVCTFDISANDKDPNVYYVVIHLSRPAAGAKRIKVKRPVEQKGGVKQSVVIESSDKKEKAIVIKSLKKGEKVSVKQEVQGVKSKVQPIKPKTKTIKKTKTIIVRRGKKGKSGNIISKTVTKSKQPPQFPSCKAAKESGFGGNRIQVKFDNRIIECEQSYAGGGWSLVLNSEQRYQGKVHIPINTMGIPFTQILFRAKKGYHFDSRVASSTQYKHDGFFFQANAFKFGDKWYIGKESHPDWAGDIAGLKQKAFYTVATDIEILEPATKCTFENSQDTKFCAKAFIFKKLPQGELTALSDIESISSSSFGNNIWDAYFQLYVR